ncbi:zinc transporter [Perilla frutescens var. hirtella]|uniref:Zinc transporter n=1 Tax=Perilla frutescens var. hirtella TaxID=608512 RepID=A0AAD4NVH3_PERFH|nr:zinc transporter [Perilla frutescens var. hirtella]
MKLARVQMEAPSSVEGHVIEVCTDDSPTTERGSGGSKACKGAVCGFSDAKTSSKDAQERSASMKKLLIAVVLCVVFMSVEVFGGIKANSLAILTDAAHLLSDVASFAISLFSLWAAGWEATPRQSYGFFRIEILGALDDHMHNHGVTVTRYDRSEQGVQKHDDHHHAHGANHSEPLLAKPEEWKIIDLICTLIFSAIVLGTTIRMLRNILEVLMESTPREIDATRLEKGLCEMDEVVAIHELHIWAITVGKVILACHVKVKPEADADMVLDKVIDYIKREYNISHVTIQIERDQTP